MSAFDAHAAAAAAAAALSTEDVADAVNDGGEDAAAAAAALASAPHAVLPIAAHRGSVLAAVAVHPCIVVQGDTGCGKSSQVPQYILAAAVAGGTRCSIVVAQPRRVAAVTLAQRVAAELGEGVGGTVGYAIGQARERSERTRITFVTTGYLLQVCVLVVSVCLSVFLAGWLAGWLSVCLSVYMSACFSV